MMAEFGAALRASSYGMDVKPLVKEACGQIFGGSGGLVDMLVRHLPSSKAATAAKVERCYSGAAAWLGGWVAGWLGGWVAGWLGAMGSNKPGRWVWCWWGGWAAVAASNSWLDGVAQPRVG